MYMSYVSTVLLNTQPDRKQAGWHPPVLCCDTVLRCKAMLCCDAYCAVTPCYAVLQHRAVLCCAVLQAVSGKGALNIPAGVYHITGPLRLNVSNTVLRGAGRGKTILYISKSLTDVSHAHESYPCVMPMRHAP